MAWRLARSLVQLRAEVDEIAPNRSKVSDGTIGNAAHEETASDHNPNDEDVVCALDLTDDPDDMADMGVIAEYLRTHRHPALKYLIHDRRIASSRNDWAWRPYSGLNAHLTHLHVSVGDGPSGESTGDYDNDSSWNIDDTWSDMATPQQIEDRVRKVVREEIDRTSERNAKRAGQWAAGLVWTRPMKNLISGKINSAAAFLTGTHAHAYYVDHQADRIEGGVNAIEDAIGDEQQA